MCFRGREPHLAGREDVAAGPACRPVRPSVLNTPIASRRASPSYPLLVLQVERVSNHIVLDEFAYAADGHFVWDEQ